MINIGVEMKASQMRILDSFDPVYKMRLSNSSLNFWVGVNLKTIIILQTFHFFDIIGMHNMGEIFLQMEQRSFISGMMMFYNILMEGRMVPEGNLILIWMADNMVIDILDLDYDAEDAVERLKDHVVEEY